MTNSSKKIELLAPAKDKETAFAAINYGADAVYIGASAFGARSKATNTLEDIQQIVDYAHLFDAKIYVTINTILTDEEITEAQELIFELYEIGVDAIIMQDMGLLECDLPPIKIFASTQCHNDSVDKVQFLEKVGFSRAILARELSLDEITEIAKSTSIEIEAFIHGALCVSYSGQCYLSYAIGRRSANRGECAQPCRKKYSLIDSKGNILEQEKCLLCLKDFNASEHLQQLIDAGVTSFKIEGRLKDINYVKNVVSYYRKLLDEIIEPGQKASLGQTEFDFEPNLEKSFNRGFTNYFLTGKRDNIHSFLTPKSLGEKIGKVAFVSQNYFILEEKNILNTADGICFFSQNELKGTNINKIDGKKIYPQNIKNIEKGLIIYRNFDFEFEKQLKNSSAKRQIETEILVEEKESKIIFSAKNPDGESAEIEMENNFEIAKNSEKMIENIKNQFQKTSETNFYVTKNTISLQKTPFIPIGKINEIRRNLLDELRKKRLKSYKKEEINHNPNDVPYEMPDLDYRLNVLNQKAKDFYKRHHAEVTEMALESGLSALGKKIMMTKHCILDATQRCRKKTKTKEQLFLVDEKGKKYKLNFDCKNCRMEIFF